MQNATLAPAAAPARDSTRTFFQKLLRVSPFFTFAGLTMVPLALVAIIGLIVDPQVITGSPAWIKPLKFAISTGIYTFTVLYLLTFVEGHRRTIAIITNVMGVGLLVEVGLITMQVVRGTTSHFNFATPFDGAVFETMAVFIVLVWTMGLVAAILLLRQRLPDAAWAWSLRLGMITALVGMAVAFLMTTPNAAQLANAQAGHGLPIGGAHTVGVTDGGPGLPLLGWSTVAGDLRVPHFFGLHGLQVLLIVGILVAQTAAWLDMRHRVAIVVTAGVAYLALIGILTWQALRAQSIMHPDALTLVSLAALALATVGVVGGVLVHGRRAA
ncbi:MAG: hypothetical protein H0X24_08210 [Ktedonobacterales bacterium]|nr:hypothetical protein [Ktedonobacterales bacterium]